MTKDGGFEGFESFDSKFFYYAKGRRVAGLWRVPTGGGEETLVLDLRGSGYWRYWTVHRDGVYLVTAANASRPLVEFFIASLEKPIMTRTPGLAVFPSTSGGFSTLRSTRAETT